MMAIMEDDTDGDNDSPTPKRRKSSKKRQEDSDFEVCCESTWQGNMQKLTTEMPRSAAATLLFVFFIAVYPCSPAGLQLDMVSNSCA